MAAAARAVTLVVAPSLSLALDSSVLALLLAGRVDTGRWEQVLSGTSWGAPGPHRYSRAMRWFLAATATVAALTALVQWRQLLGKAIVSGRTRLATLTGRGARKTSSSQPPVRYTACIICADEAFPPAAAPCGHVACWRCVVGWATEKEQCVVCRSPATKNQIVRLMNVK